MIVSAATAGDAAQACRNPVEAGCAGRLSTVTNGDSERLGKASGLSRCLLALLVGLLAMVALIASGAPSAAAQTRVGAQPQILIFAVGPTSTATPDNVGLHAVPQLRLVSATGVAAETATDAASVGFRSDATHIFRNAAGHFADDTAANRAIIRGAVDPANLRSTITLKDGATLSKYFQTLPDGTQAWAEVRNGTDITNGGLNVIPR